MSESQSKKKGLFSTASIIKNLLKISFVVGVLYYMWSEGHINIERTLQAFTKLNFMIPAVCLLALPIFLTSFRLKLLLKGQKIEVSFLQAVSLTLIGMFFNTTLPGAVSGDVVKGYYLIQLTPGLRKTQGITAMLVDRILGVSGLIVMATTVLAFKSPDVIANPKLHPIAFTIMGFGGGVFVFLAFVLLPFSQSLGNFLDKIEHIHIGKVGIGSLFKKFILAVRSYRDNLPVLLGTLALSVFIHCLVTVAFSLMAQAVGETNLTLSDYAFLTPLGLITTAIPIAPAGMGVGHGAFQWLYSLKGSNVGADTFTLLVSFNVFIGLCGSIPYLMFKKPGENLTQMSEQLEENP